MKFQFLYTIIILVYYRLKGCVFLKKLLSFVLCLCILISCIVFLDKMPIALSGTSGVYESVEPVTPPESDFVYKKLPINAPTKIVITGYTGPETKVIVPDTIEGLPVTNITYSAFAKNEKLTYIKLPSALLGIPGNAFTLCSSLTEIDIDSSNNIFTSIDGILYRKDTDVNSNDFGKIKTLSVFPAGKGGKFTIPYGIETINSYAFNYCYKLTEVDMYNTVTTINSYAFSHCWNLKKIRLSDNLNVLGVEALANCDSLTKIELPTNLTNIGKDAVLGTIDSNNNKVYYFTEGISCTKGSYAHQYLLDQALPPSIIDLKNHTVTDNDTGIKIIDAYNTLPKETLFDINVSPISLSEIEHLFPTRYSSALAFDINFTNNGDVFSPKSSIIISFDSVFPDAIPSATKIYQQKGDKLVLVSGSANSPFVGAQISEGGRFIILSNNDFSLKGDIDGDGTVTLFDVKAAIHASTNTLNLTPEQRLTANIDNSQDGKITTQDARKILRLAGGMNIE